MTTRSRAHDINRRRRVGAAAIGAGALLATVLVAPVASAAPGDATDSRPWVQGDRTIPYFDVEQAVVDNVNIKTGMDGDENGVEDTIRVQITRPDGSGPSAKVPLIVHASPYFGKGSRSAWETNYYVPRGYAVATVSLPGTDYSTGCSDVGGDLEVLGSVAIVDWVNGRTTATHVSGGAAVANWATGKVGMVGVSWDGTIANSVASTGVEGLETIVPVAAISSWYDYTRGNGITYYDDHVGFLHEYVSNFDSAFCRGLTDVLNTAADDATSSYNDFWADRDYRPDASKIEASVFLVHGLIDENVKTGQYGYWWDELEKYDVDRKLFLHQQAHVEPYYSFGAAYADPLTEWFDYYLQGLGDDPSVGSPAIIQRESGAWTEEAQYPPADTKNTKMTLSKPLARVGALTPAGVPVDGVQAKKAKIIQTAAYSSDSIVNNPTQERTDRAVFLSSELDDAIRQAGTAQVRLRVKVNEELAGFQARVVDYSSSGAAYIVSRTMASLNHNAGLDEYETLQPGKWYTLTWNIHTDDRVWAEGRRLGLVITPERQNIEGSYTPFEATIKLKKSWLKMPLTGEGTVPATIDAVSPSVGTSVENPVERKSLEEFTRELFEGSNS